MDLLHVVQRLALRQGGPSKCVELPDIMQETQAPLCELEAAVKLAKRRGWVQVVSPDAIRVSPAAWAA